MIAPIFVLIDAVTQTLDHRTHSYAGISDSDTAQRVLDHERTLCMMPALTIAPTIT